MKPLKLAKIALLAAALHPATADAQDADELERCILLADAAYKTYKGCVSQVISYHAAKVKHPDIIITFAKQQCGAYREQYVRVLTGCMGRDVADAVADSEEAGDLIPHLHALIDNAGRQKVHGDPTPPAPDDPFYAPMAFHLLEAASTDGVLILAQGSIDAGTPARFEHFLDEVGLTNGRGRVRFNSPGGELLPALALGREIRARALSTEVETNSETRPQCVSACVYAFLGGVARHAAVGHIGVHRFHHDLALSDPERRAYDSNDLAEVQRLSALLADYVVAMGARADLIARAADVAVDEISYLTAAELVEMRVVFGGGD